MSVWQTLRGKIEAQNLAWTIGILSILVAASAKAAEPLNVSDLPATAKTVKEWVAQVEAATVQVTDVKLERTDTGLDITLETAEGKPLQVDATKFRREGNNLIADIPNAVLALPQRQTFVADKPTTDIATVQVVQQEGNLRIIVAGNNAPPKTAVTLKTGGLTYSLNPEGNEPELEINVIGLSNRRSYKLPNATTATKTDTPLQDIPQSIQVVPRQVLEDRGVRRELETVETVSGVVDNESSRFFGGANVAIRGFGPATRLRNGLRGESGASLSTSIPPGTINRVEVLKGPASVLFGALEPGGVINFVTQQPLSQPYYKIGFEAGSYGYYSPSIDLSGPLTQDKNILYRLIASYKGGGEFKDDNPVEDRLISIAPSISFKIGDRTDLSLYYEYGSSQTSPTTEPIRSDGSLIPRGVSADYFSSQDNKYQRTGYDLTHRFNDNWQLRHNLTASFSTRSLERILARNFQDDRFLTTFNAFSFRSFEDTYFGLVDLTGEFKTGSITHKLVAGFDSERVVGDFANYRNSSVDLPPRDIFNPSRISLLPEIPSGQPNFRSNSQNYGVYVQDQIAFTDRLKVLIGGRYDWLSGFEFGAIGEDNPPQNDGAFSPRIGLVYQPSKNVSLYTSYSQSLRPSLGRNPDNIAFKPTRGTQYEVGARADFLDGRLSANLAAYSLTKTNVLTPNPDPILADQGFSVQVGEQQSRGIELDVTGRILPGWNIIAAYALTDAQVTADTNIPNQVGNRLQNIPQHQASLWTTYEIQKGDLQGLGFGLGLFYVGKRQGDLANSFQIGDYLRTDAALYYRRNEFNAGINVRNLFDLNYVSSSFSALNVNRGEPLTITASVGWEF